MSIGADLPEVRTVAVVDDDPVLRRMVRAWLAADGLEVVEFSDGRSALASRAGGAQLVILDLGLGDMTGLDLFAHLREQDPELSVIVASAARDVDVVVSAMRLGALDYLAKPLDAQRVRDAAKRAFDRQRGLDAVRSSRVQQGGGLAGVIGGSAAMRAVSEQVRRVLESEVTVCLLGESGVGKEVVARAIHENGRRHKGAFVAVNCAAIPHALQESELFGHERGSFTGANATHKGRFEQAQNGTLFLDELGEMSAATQAALLRTLQEKTVRRVGGTAEIAVNARIVCATHRDLEAEVDAGRFRKDLYYRLVVYPIEIPPLRERREDIPLLMGHFMKRLSADVGRSVTRVAPEALDVLVRYEWPGNVRELQNVVHRAMLSCDAETIALEHLPASLRKIALPVIQEPPVVTAATGVASAELASDDAVIALAEVERRAIIRAMAAAQGSVARAAKLLGIGRTTLYRRLNELGLPPDKP